MSGNKLVSNEELLVSNMLEIQALIRILEKKGITNQDEILAEVKKLQVEMEEKIKRMGRNAMSNMCQDFNLMKNIIMLPITELAMACLQS